MAKVKWQKTLHFHEFIQLKNVHNFSRQLEVVKKHKNRCNFASFEGIMNSRDRRKYEAIRNMVHHPDYHSQYYVMKMNVF